MGVKTETKDKAAPAATTTSPAAAPAGDQTVSLEKKGDSTLAPADMFLDYEDEAGAGKEEQDLSLIKIPQLVVLQSSSKLIKLPKPQRPPGLDKAEPGMIMNTVTKELYDGTKGIEIIPVYFRKRFYLRTDDMEHRGVLLPDDTRVAKALREGEFGDYRVGDLQMIETVELFVTYTTPGSGPRAAVIICQSTKIPKFKDWNTAVTGYVIQGKNGPFNPSLYANRTTMRTEFNPGKKDQAYFDMILEPAVKNVEGVPDYRLSINPKSDSRYAVAVKLHTDLLDMKIEPEQAGASEVADTGRGDKGKDGGF